MAREVQSRRTLGKRTGTRQRQVGSGCRIVRVSSSWEGDCSESRKRTYFISEILLNRYSASWKVLSSQMRLEVLVQELEGATCI